MTADSTDINCFNSDLEKSLETLIINIYNNSLVPRNVIPILINDINKLFCNKILPALINVITFKEKHNEEGKNAIIKICQNVFNMFNSEYKCLKYFEKTGNYIPPRDMYIGHETCSKRNNKSKNLEFESKPINGKIIP